MIFGRQLLEAVDFHTCNPVPQLQVCASGGVGVSVVQQSPPQELVYALLSGILLDYNSSPTHRTLDATIRDIQVAL